MDSVDKPADEIAFDELAAIVREKDELGISFTAYLQKLEKEAEAAQRKLAVAKAHADTCSATKLRKPRRDRGTKRKKAVMPAPVETATGPEAWKAFVAGSTESLAGPPEVAVENVPET